MIDVDGSHSCHLNGTINSVKPLHETQNSDTDHGKLSHFQVTAEGIQTGNVSVTIYNTESCCVPDQLVVSRRHQHQMPITT